MLKRPQGPMGTEDFLQTLLEVTMSDIELVGIIELQTIMVMSRKCTLSVVKNENMNLFLIGKSSSSPCGQEVLWEARAVPQDRGLSLCFCIPTFASVATYKYDHFKLCFLFCRGLLCILCSSFWLITLPSKKSPVQKWVSQSAQCAPHV